MDNRHRLLAILDRRPPDRIPWIPRLELWYRARLRTDSMPEAWRGLSLREIEHRLGVGTPARDGRIFRQRMEGVEVQVHREGMFEVKQYRTPVGSLRQVMRFSHELDRLGLPGRVVEYPLKSPADYRIWEWILDHTYWDPDYEAYQQYDADIGCDGLPMVQVGDVPFHEFLEDLVGYEYGFYHLMDFASQVEGLLEHMQAVQRERLWPVIEASPAKLILHGAHLSSQFTPPRLFERYILPYYQEFIPRMHDAGKFVAMHADNDTQQILELIEQAGWDMVECFVTAPMVPVTLAEAREAWGTRVIIWGGVPSLLLSPSVSEEELEHYMDELFRVVAPGDAFILGVADNVMPDSEIERVAKITEWVETRGYYPIS